MVLQGIFTVSHFLAEEAYREPILLGFVYSSGGIDGPLADAVTEALNLHSSSGRAFPSPHVTE